MTSIVIRIVDKNNADEVQTVEGELDGAGFTVIYRGEAVSLGVDGSTHGGDRKIYADAVVIVAKKD